MSLEINHFMLGIMSHSLWSDKNSNGHAFESFEGGFGLFSRIDVVNVGSN